MSRQTDRQTRSARRFVTRSSANRWFGAASVYRRPIGLGVAALGIGAMATGLCAQLGGLRPSVSASPSIVERPRSGNLGSVSLTVTNPTLKAVVATVASDCCSQGLLRTYAIPPLSARTVDAPIDWSRVRVERGRLGLAVHLTGSGKPRTQGVWLDVREPGVAAQSEEKAS